MNLKMRKVSGVCRQAIPKKVEDIETDFPEVPEKIYPIIKEVAIYFREEAKSNETVATWVIDFIFMDDNIFYVKLPGTMTSDEVKSYAKPLFERFGDKCKFSGMDKNLWSGVVGD